ncbi:MAG TPA: RIP metalloprotease RseP [Bryobacteraceae bacterium]|nr:RIP metalloprotease RseP [Bryobacteraceae bacterium]
MQFVENLLWLLVLIGVMINIHELGHYIAARYFDVHIEVFSFGFGTRLFGFRRGETDFRFSAIPFGGYVKMTGETVADLRSAEASVSGLRSVQTADLVIDDPRAFLAKPRWQRLIILFAGPFMNAVLAIGILTGMYMVKYQRVSDADMQANIGHVVADSPAAKAGIQDGDRIVGLDGKANPTWEDVGLKEVTGAYRPMYLTIERNGRRFNTTVTPILSERLGVGYAGWDERGEVQFGPVEAGYPADKAGLKKGDLLLAVNGQPIHSRVKFHQITESNGPKPMELEISRNGEKHTITVQPGYFKLDGPARWMIGVQVESKLTLITTRLSFPAALQESVKQNSQGALLMAKVLEGMLERRMSAKNLTGPIGMIQLSGDAAREGVSEYLGFMAMVSLQLAIFNLLPIPVLDGGTILMLLIEMTMRRDLSLNVKETVFKVGFVCIMMLVAFVIYNDISRYLPAG